MLAAFMWLRIGHWWAVVNTVMWSFVFHESGELLSSATTVSFSKNSILLVSLSEQSI
jgi:hypothetical protein